MPEAEVKLVAGCRMSAEHLQGETPRRSGRSCLASLLPRRKLTAYDASYLWLAAELGANLLTLDAGLMRAWKRHRA